ncbi:hypothetical protein HPP92_026640 [Vanilla planifolia]|uniref:TF-B3 domain-containing protein n=1 Tax=Vanilla planifolia TaxID=51239 RepID=A0A835PF08_VANPL|nr:hypothetical protein HPP92_026640 [Vanilla planifolia]
MTELALLIHLLHPKHVEGPSMGEDCRHCKKWVERCRKFEEHFYWNHVDVRRMHFSKSMSGDFSNCMIIPQKYIDHFNGELLETVELKVPSGDKWHVELKKTNDGVILECGWKNFVEEHGIQENDMLVFKYDGCSSFLVLMFEQSGCEKAASYCTKKRDHSNQLCASSSSSGKKVKHCVNGSYPEHSGHGLHFTGNHRPPSVRENSEEKLVKLRCKSRKTPVAKKLSIHARRKKPLSVTQNPPTCFSLEKQCKPREFFISRKARLSDAEKNRVLNFAGTIETDNPSFLSIMVPSSVGKRYSVTIPMSFAVEFFPQANLKHSIVLQLPDKKRLWAVRFLVQGHSVVISSGWKEFVHDNKLRVGEICLFELVEVQKDILMTVHINRVEEAVQS